MTWNVGNSTRPIFWLLRAHFSSKYRSQFIIGNIMLRGTEQHNVRPETHLHLQDIVGQSGFGVGNLTLLGQISCWVQITINSRKCTTLTFWYLNIRIIKRFHIAKVILMHFLRLCTRVNTAFCIFNEIKL